MKLKQISLLTVIGLALSGCLGGTMDGMGSGQIQAMPHEKFPIQVSPVKEEMSLVVSPYAFAVSKYDKARVAEFASAYKRVGHGDIWIVAPEGSQNSASSIGAVAELSAVMVDRGLSREQIKMRSYHASGSDAPITIRFVRYTASTRPCGDWSRSVAFEPNNSTTANFGCASQSNLAVMVVDPHDLVQPRDMDPADAQRRMEVIGKYRAGESTGSARSDDESGTVSEVE
jgi:pilus assembly protein CpaD